MQVDSNCEIHLVHIPFNGSPSNNPIALVVDVRCSHVRMIREVGRFFQRAIGLEESRFAGC